MRSRYTAFVLGNVPYLERSWDPATRPEVVDVDPGIRWQGLTILRTERGRAADDRGVVEFSAAWSSGARSGEQHEISVFRRVRGAWVYRDAEPDSPQA